MALYTEMTLAENYDSNKQVTKPTTSSKRPKSMQKDVQATSREDFLLAHLAAFAHACMRGLHTILLAGYSPLDQPNRQKCPCGVKNWWTLHFPRPETGISASGGDGGYESCGLMIVNMIQALSSERVGGVCNLGLERRARCGGSAKRRDWKMDLERVSSYAILQDCGAYNYFDRALTC